MFGKLFLFSGLKISNLKCEIARIGVKKGVKDGSLWNGMYRFSGERNKAFRYLLLLQ